MIYQASNPATWPLDNDHIILDCISGDYIEAWVHYPEYNRPFPAYRFYERVGVIHNDDPQDDDSWYEESDGNSFKDGDVWNLVEKTGG